MMEEKQQGKTIQWFPGHMAKTRRLIKAGLPLVDAVVELRDARIVRASRNPEIEQLTKSKPRLIILNKADMADEKVTDEWREFFVKYKKRILFGTDCNTMKASNKDLVRLVYRKLTESTGLFTQKCYGRDFVVHGLELDDDTVDCICRTNFDDFAGLSPKAVDKEMLLACIKRILCDLRDNPHDEYYIKGYDFIPGLADDPDQRNAWHFCRYALDTL